MFFLTEERVWLSRNFEAIGTQEKLIVVWHSRYSWRNCAEACRTLEWCTRKLGCVQRQLCSIARLLCAVYGFNLELFCPHESFMYSFMHSHVTSVSCHCAPLQWFYTGQCLLIDIMHKSDVLYLTMNVQSCGFCVEICAWCKLPTLLVRQGPLWVFMAKCALLKVTNLRDGYMSLGVIFCKESIGMIARMPGWLQPLVFEWIAITGPDLDERTTSSPDLD